MHTAEKLARRLTHCVSILFKTHSQTETVEIILPRLTNKQIRRQTAFRVEFNLRYRVCHMNVPKPHLFNPRSLALFKVHFNRPLKVTSRPLRPISIDPYQSRLGLHNSLFPSVPPSKLCTHTSTCYMSRPSHLLDLTTRTVFREYKSLRHLRQSPVAESLAVPTLLLRTLFSNTHKTHVASSL